MSRTLPPSLIHQSMHGFVLSNPADFVKFFRECFGDYAESLGLTLLAKYWTKQGNHRAQEVLNIQVDSLAPGPITGSSISLSSNTANSADPVGTVVGTLSVNDATIYPNPEFVLVNDGNGAFALNGNDIEIAAPIDASLAQIPITLTVQGVGTRFHAVRTANVPDVGRVVGDGLEVVVPNMYRVIAANRTCQTRRFRIRVKDYSQCQAKIIPFYELIRVYFPQAILTPAESDSDIQLQQADIVIDLVEMIGARANGRTAMFEV